MSGPRKEMVNKMNVTFATHLKLTLQWEIQPKKIVTNTLNTEYRIKGKKTRVL